MLTRNDMVRIAAEQYDQNDALARALKAIIKMLDGSQPTDIPGAIMVAQNAIKLFYNQTKQEVV